MYEDAQYFLPDWPKITGREAILKITDANAVKYLDSEAADLIKGLHLIEEQYKKLTNNDFGFGSPSPTYKLISKLKYKDANMAEALTRWISEHGGNYYIKSL